jgi:hypothetical protein
MLKALNKILRFFKRENEKILLNYGFTEDGKISTINPYSDEYKNVNSGNE